MGGDGAGGGRQAHEKGALEAVDAHRGAGRPGNEASIEGEELEGDGIGAVRAELSSYLLMELDNKKIARLMRIKPESVHQARWRLRRRLAIPEGTALEEFLRQLNKSASTERHS